ncbi:MAG TPA: hypothetical protein VFR24_27665 [Candidatus Angelobacter sp.]|nr:hypothetical protein [Candidatus Angelobacter sp.]
MNERNKLKCFAINYFGDHEHPEATELTLPFFHEEYIRKCVRKMLDSDMISEEAKCLGKEVMGVIPFPGKGH